MRWLFLLSFILSPPLVIAQGRSPVPPHPPFAIESAETFQFRSFEDDRGGFYVIWPHQGEKGMVLLAQHVDLTGKTLWEQPGVAMVSDLAPGALWEARADGQGGGLIVWEANSGIQGRRFNAEAKTLWLATKEVVNRSTFTQKRPALAADGAGGAYIIWQEKRLPNRWVLMAQHINALGATLWNVEGTRVSLRPSDQQRPNAVYDGSAGVVVVWHDAREKASQLQAQRLNYQGTRMWGAEGVWLTAPSGDTTQPPAVGAVGSGGAVFAWQTSSSSADRIFLQVIGPTGESDWAQGKEVSVGTWHEWNPILHGDGQGGTWVGWEDYRNNTSWQVFVHHFHADGKPAWAQGELALTTVRADQGRLALTDDARGGVLATWVDNRLGSTGIYWQRVNEQGEVLQDSDGVLVAKGLVNPQTPQILSLAPLQGVVLWADETAKGRWTLSWKLLGL